MKAETVGHSTITVGDFDIPLSLMYRTTWQKINKEMKGLNNNRCNRYRTLHPITAEYTFFSSVQGTFSKIDHMPGHTTSLSKLKRSEIIQCMFSEHIG